MNIYLIAIGGTGMAPLACLLQESGHTVRGSDLPLYPPMSSLLEEAGIRPLVGFEAGHLEPRPDLVVVGNAVPRQNPEAQEVERLGLHRISMPQALARFFLAGREPLVVAGTHGKTTTSSMAAWAFAQCGADPGYFLGGVPLDMPASFRRGAGRHFIVEGDEYNASYFDRGPKFLHYRPHILILTSAEYDHADLYATPEALRQAYADLLEILPGDGLLVACGDDPEVRRIARRAPCRAILYGFGEDNDLRPAGVELAPSGTSCLLPVGDGSSQEVHLGLSGQHNLSNAMAVWAAALAAGLPAPTVAAALARFHGVRRRMEVLGIAAGVTVVDDFAHHPTAVAATLGGLRQRYPERRLVAIFEPRSLTAARSLFYSEYLEAFSNAEAVVLAPVFHRRRLEPEQRLDVERLAGQLLERGVAAAACASIDEVLDRTLLVARHGDVLVVMSSGSFDRMPRRLLEELRSQREHGSAR